MAANGTAARAAEAAGGADRDRERQRASLARIQERATAAAERRERERKSMQEEVERRRAAEKKVPRDFFSQTPSPRTLLPFCPPSSAGIPFPASSHYFSLTTKSQPSTTPPIPFLGSSFSPEPVARLRLRARARQAKEAHIALDHGAIAREAERESEEMAAPRAAAAAARQAAREKQVARAPRSCVRVCCAWKCYFIILREGGGGGRSEGTFPPTLFLAS